jgi:anti-anti-sigma factor
MRDRIVEFDLAEQGRVLVARFAGEVDASNAGELRLVISERLPATATGLVLDLSAVTYLDSSGIHLLFDLGRRLRARRQAVRLVVPEGAPVRRVLALCNVDGVAPMETSATAAVRAIEAGAEL